MHCNSKHIYQRITADLLTIGIPLQVLGFLYLREAVKLCAEDTSLRMGNFFKKVYASVAQKMDTSVSKVERNIRHAIGAGWETATANKLNSLIGTQVFSPTLKPTNSMLIILLADKIYLDSMV